MIALGQNIKMIRKLKNLSQRDIAEKLHMSVANYSNMENGITEITVNRLKEIAKILKVDYLQILSLTPAQILNSNGKSPYNNGGNQTNYQYEELVKQLQIKDKQIQKLSALQEKALSK